jgi:hypothetical protein
VELSRSQCQIPEEELRISEGISELRISEVELRISEFEL